MSALPTIPSPRFDYAPHERELFDAARAIAARHAPADRTALSQPALVALFKDLAPLGYLGSVLPREAGGHGLPSLAFAALVDGLSPALTLVGNHSVQRYLHSFGTRAQRERFLPDLLSGAGIGAIAITEPDAGSNLGGLATTARREGDRIILNGRKAWVTHGMVATVFIVLAQMEPSADGPGGLTRFVVPGDALGLGRTAQSPVGLTHLTFAEVAFDQVSLEPELQLGAEGRGADGAKAAFPIARGLVALQAARIAEAALDLGRDFARARQIRSGRLAHSTSVQHGYAALWARAEAARLFALSVLDAMNAPDAVTRASAAKSLATDVAMDATAWAVATLGAEGLSSAGAAQRLQADAQMLSVVDGTSMLNALVVARRTIADDLSRERQTT